MKRFFNRYLQKCRADKRWILLPAAALLLLVLIIIACVFFRPVNISEAYAFSLDETSLRLTNGMTAQLHPVFTPLDERKAKKAARRLEQVALCWSSSDPSVAEVGPDGTLTALHPGTAVITASYEDLTASCDVTVYVPMESLSFDTNVLECNVGDTFPLSFTVKPSDAYIPDDISFASSRDDIASVDEAGTVTAFAPGKTVLTITIGDLTADCELTVFAPLKSISLNETELDLEGGETFLLEVSYSPENTTDPTDVSWSSSDPDVAAVDETGLLTAAGPGEAIVTAAVGDFSASCTVHVTIPMTGISMSVSSLTIRAGESVTLPLSYNPGNTTDDRLTEWTSSNPAVASVSSNGTVRAAGTGKTTITASCGNFTASCQITVIIPVTAVSISQTALTLNRGTSASLSAAIAPSNTTEQPYISWSSDNTAVASVSGGVVTAVGAGTATITASHDDIAASCTVTVLSPMTGISFEQSSVTIIQGYSAPLSLTFAPADTTDSRNASWSSDNPAVASVADGIVTAVAEGTCTVTAVVGAFRAQASVTVTPYIAVDSVTLNSSALTFDSIGQQAALTASVLPANASEHGVSWSSSNSSVATVSADGIVTAVGSGSAVIRAAAGDKSASCTVTVAAANKVVVLDPGHGGAFSGAYYNGLHEEDLNLKVAQYCKAYLESHYSGVTVYLTRTGDTQLASTLKEDLEARAQFAQDKGADILVSLHFNASTGHNASGTLAFVSKQANVAAASNSLANQILSRIAAMGLKNQGAFSASSDTYFDEYGNPLDYYAINRHCANRGIPGIIVEHCFMDYDTAFLDEAHLQQFGAADAAGIAAYLGLH